MVTLQSYRPPRDSLSLSHPRYPVWESQCIRALSTESELLVDWARHTPQSSIEEVDVRQSCGCVIRVWIRYLPRSARNGSGQRVTTTVTSFPCAEHVPSLLSPWTILTPSSSRSIGVVRNVRTGSERIVQDVPLD